MHLPSRFSFLAAGLLLAGCTPKSSADRAAVAEQHAAALDTAARQTTPVGESTPLPAPFATKSVRNFSKVIGWPEGKMPTAPAGFVVTEYARDLDHPRWLYVLPNGDVVVALASTTPTTTTKKVAAALKLDPSKSLNSTSANTLVLLRDTNKDGRPDARTAFLNTAESPDKPFGMLLLGNTFYVAGTDELRRYPYKEGQQQLTGAGEKILDLPRGGYNNHWTRNLLASPDGKKIYVTVGSGSNVQEHGPENEVRRANILQINPDGSGEKVYASGLRNPVGLAWAPGTNTLWTAVNERDELGDDLVPDYITSVQEGGFYGWPYSYFGQHEDPRLQGQRPELVKKAIVPDVPLGAHTASLGLAFCTQKTFPAKYQGGAFVGQHGSWNRSELSGYKVVFVPFSGGKPSGPMEDFLTGFIADPAKQEVYGRPVGVTSMPDGALLVTDDASGRIWRVTAAK
jgi:glucose/arabinose dehydrogenase